MAAWCTRVGTLLGVLGAVGCGSAEMLDAGTRFSGGSSDASTTSEGGMQGEGGAVDAASGDAAPDAGSVGFDAGVTQALDAGSGVDADAGNDAALVLDAGVDASPDASANVDAAPTDVCVPGIYRGTFVGKLSVSFIGFSLELFDISGDIEIEAYTSDTNNDLTIEGGRIDGADADGNPVSADVSGVLNCTTFQLENGRLSNGTYTRMLIGQTVNFEGTAEATYQPGPTPRVDGSWSVEGGIESGQGTFEASLAIPANP